MEALWGWEIVAAVQGLHKSGSKESLIKGISTDTRLLKAGELFVALQGKKYDGHDFLPLAVEKGAAGLLVSREIDYKPPGVLVVQVNDTVEALGRLARYYRHKRAVKVVAITGTNGKTSTKDMTHHVLSSHFCTLSSKGNYNNFIGVPLTLFQLEPYHGLAIIEMGTNAPGEIRWLSWVAQPQIGVITNISEAHLEGLGSVEGVAMAKAEILEGIPSNGHLVFNLDNPLCQVIARTFHGNTVSFGFREGADIRATEVVKEEGRVSFVINGRHNVSLNVPGIHNVYNALAALSIGYCLNVDIRELCSRLEDFQLPLMRMERHNSGGVTIINDAYNANPASMNAALTEFSHMAVPGQKCFICGDMAELGKEASRFHHELGERIAEASVDLLLVTGQFATEVASAANKAGMSAEQIHVCDDLEQVFNTATMRLKAGDAVLLKGSRCMRLEEVCNRLKEYFSNGLQADRGRPPSLSK